jgi:hypothetical protein
MFIPISTFNKIVLDNPKTLVICDIDNTLLYWDKNTYDFYEMIREDSFDFTQQEIEKEALSMLNIYKVINTPKITDLNGFNNLIKKIKLFHNSKIIFLTARNCNITNDNKFTRKNFESIGLNYDDFSIHYTNNNISKGDYIQKNINLEKYNEVIFIDDYECNIKSVKDIFSFINCYKFEIVY